MKQNTKGGKRKGSGRKKASYETKTIAFRVRVEFVEPIKKWSKIMFRSVCKVTHNGKAFVSGGHRCNLILTASCPPACTNAVLAAV